MTSTDRGFLIFALNAAGLVAVSLPFRADPRRYLIPVLTSLQDFCLPPSLFVPKMWAPFFFQWRLQLKLSTEWFLTLWPFPRFPFLYLRTSDLNPLGAPFPTLLSFALGTLKGSASLDALFGAVASGSQPIPSSADPPSFPAEDISPCPPTVNPGAPKVAPVIRTSCPYCDKPFKTQKGLNSHLVSVHSYGTTDSEGVPRSVRAATRQPAITDFISVESPDITEICFVEEGRLRGAEETARRMAPLGLSSCPSGGDSTNPAGDTPQSSSSPEAAGPVPTFLSKFQRDLSDKIKGVGSAEELDEAYSQFIHALGCRPSRRRGGPRNPTPRNNKSRHHQPSAGPAELTSSMAGPSPRAPFKTQKGLNSHLVSVHSYGTMDLEGVPRPIRAATRQPAITDFISVGSPEVLEICETAPPETPSKHVASVPYIEATVPVPKHPKAKRVRFDLP
ncbi:hypothetical protein NPIL_48621, partial [Nephila pilipes]